MLVFISFASLGFKEDMYNNSWETFPFHYKNNINKAIFKNSQCIWQHILVSGFWELIAAAK